jgi:hypothetical protein
MNLTWRRGPRRRHGDAQILDRAVELTCMGRRPPTPAMGLNRAIVVLGFRVLLRRLDGRHAQLRATRPRARSATRERGETRA